MQVKIDLRNGISNIINIEETMLEKLMSKIGTRKGNKIWRGYDKSREFIMAVVPNEIVTINRFDLMENKEKFLK